MWNLIIAGGIIGIDYVYHRWINPPPSVPAPKPNREFQIAKVEEGTAVPIFCGTVRIDAPVLVWAGFPRTLSGEDANAAGFVTSSQFLYFLDMFFAVGIGFYNGVSKIENAWVGDTKLAWFNPLLVDGDVDDGAIIVEAFPGIDPPYGGQLVFYDGRESQLMADGGDGLGATHGEAAFLMKIDQHREIPSYRGYLTTLLSSAGPIDPDTGPQFSWCIGSSSSVPQHSFEASTFPTSSLDAQKIGDKDANPIDFLWEILRQRFGKLGLDAVVGTVVDYDSFRNAAERCKLDGLGYSRVWNDVTPTAEIVTDVLRYVDGTIYQDMSDGKIKIFLIRPDEDPTAAPEINPSNCVDLEPVQLGGRTGLVNRVRVKYTNRNNDYKVDTESADNLAGSTAQDGEVNEELIEFLGCTSATKAAELAARELGGVGRPVLKFRAIVDKSFGRVHNGKLVALTWPPYNLSGNMFRIARVIPGGPKSNTMTLELVSYIYYVQRTNVPSNTGGLPHHDPVG